MQSKAKERCLFILEPLICLTRTIAIVITVLVFVWIGVRVKTEMQATCNGRKVNHIRTAATLRYKR